MLPQTLLLLGGMMSVCASGKSYSLIHHEEESINKRMLVVRLHNLYETQALALVLS